MKTVKNKTRLSPKKEVNAEQIWEPNKMNRLRDFILSESKKQSPERKLRNELLSIRFQIEDYIEKDKVENEMRIFDFVKLYLKSLNITQKDLAEFFEMRDSNLYKYLIGERKLNQDLVLKLSSFSHTPPEIWYYIQTKNELNELKAQEVKLRKYEKYDYRTLYARAK